MPPHPAPAQNAALSGLSESFCQSNASQHVKTQLSQIQHTVLQHQQDISGETVTANRESKEQFKKDLLDKVSGLMEFINQI